MRMCVRACVFMSVSTGTCFPWCICGDHRIIFGVVSPLQLLNTGFFVVYPTLLFFVVYPLASCFSEIPLCLHLAVGAQGLQTGRAGTTGK